MTDAQRADAWDAFNESGDADALTTRLQGMKIPDTVKADLWDLKASAKPAAAAPEQAGALSRFVGGAAEMLNPITAVQGIASAVMHPIDTAAGIYGAMEDQGRKADAAFARGDTLEGVLRTGAQFPILGPLAADIVDQGASGDIAGAAGKVTGLITGPGIYKGAMTGAARGAQAVRGATRGALTATPEVQAATRWALEQGIPVDAATASGNKVARAAKWSADSSVGGAVPGMQAQTARAEALERTGRGLAAKVSPTAQTAETAGEGIRGGVEGVIRSSAEQADASYGRVRAAERVAQPDDVPIRPRVGAKVAPEDAAMLSWMADDLDELRFERGGSTRAMRDDAYANARAGEQSGFVAAGRVAGSQVQHMLEAAGIGGSKAEQSARLRKALRTGTDEKALAVSKILREAWDGQKFDWDLVSDEAKLAAGVRRRDLVGRAPSIIPAEDTPFLSSIMPDMGGAAPAARTLEPMQFAVPLVQTKAALRPVYERLMRKKELTGSLMGDEGRAITALDALIGAEDFAPLSVVDAALGDLKAAARGAAMPELRSNGQGIAALAVQELEAAVQAKAKSVGVWDDLRAGRDATIAKWTAAETLDKLRAEPVQTFRLLTSGGDAAIDKLREVKRLAPAEMPKIGRAYLDGLLDTATAEGGFGREAKLWAEWQKLGPETKAVLYPDPALRSALDNFFLIGRKMAENPNPSGSALVGGLTAQGFMTLIDPVTSAATAIGGFTLSKLLNSPSTAKLLTQAMQTPKTATAAKGLAARLRVALRAVPGKSAALPAGAVLSQQSTAGAQR
jgi:hypothetical protein